MFVMCNFFSLVTCSALILSDGGISYNKSPLNNGGYPVGTVAEFSCNFGYSQSQSNSRTCQLSGMWNQQTPICNQSKLVYFGVLLIIVLLNFFSITYTQNLNEIFLL